MLANELEIDHGSNLESVYGLLVFLCAIYWGFLFIFPELSRCSNEKELKIEIGPPNFKTLSHEKFIH